MGAAIAAGASDIPPSTIDRYSSLLLRCSTAATTATAASTGGGGGAAAATVATAYATADASANVPQVIYPRHRSMT